MGNPLAGWYPGVYPNGCAWACGWQRTAQDEDWTAGEDARCVLPAYFNYAFTGSDWRGRLGGSVFHLDRIEERHGRAQLCADLLHQQTGFVLPHLGEVLPAGLVLLDPVFGERAVLDFGEELLHLGAGGVGDDARAGGVVAVLGGVADGVAHVGEAAAIHEVDDQLELVQALEVGDLRLIAGVDQRLEAGLDQRGRAAAEHGLLAEEVGFGLFREGGFENAAARAADGLGVGERELFRLAGGVLLRRR